MYILPLSTFQIELQERHVGITQVTINLHLEKVCEISKQDFFPARIELILARTHVECFFSLGSKILAVIHGRIQFHQILVAFLQGHKNLGFQPTPGGRGALLYKGLTGCAA